MAFVLEFPSTQLRVLADLILRRNYVTTAEATAAILDIVSYIAGKALLTTKAETVLTFKHVESDANLTKLKSMSPQERAAMLDLAAEAGAPQADGEGKFKSAVIPWGLILDLVMMYLKDLLELPNS